MYDRILLPTDGSPGSDHVVDQAAELAATTGATLYVVSVVDEEASFVTPETVEATREALTDAGERAVARAADRATGTDVTVETEVRTGTPHQVIVEYADEIDADVIVMGTHGRSGLERYLLGSVTERVLRLADQPVLAVKIRAGELGNGVSGPEEAETVARENLDDEGIGVAELREVPYREVSTWVVPVLTEDDKRVNVHVDAASGNTRIARLDR